MVRLDGCGERDRATLGGDRERVMGISRPGRKNHAIGIDARVKQRWYRLDLACLICVRARIEKSRASEPRGIVVIGRAPCCSEVISAGLIFPGSLHHERAGTAACYGP